VQYWNAGDLTQYWVLQVITPWVVLSGLQPDIQYRVILKAIDSAGSWSAWSATTDIKTLP
jgi:hypothetical protein